MFDRWRQINMTDIMLTPARWNGVAMINQQYAGASNPAVIAAREEYLDSSATSNQVIINAVPSSQWKASNTPVNVATPLPPRKPKNNG